jgi:hypothetical protein
MLTMKNQRNQQTIERKANVETLGRCTQRPYSVATVGEQSLTGFKTPVRVKN